MPTPLFSDLSDADAVAVVEEFLGRTSGIEFTEKLAGQHITAESKDGSDWIYSTKSGSRGRGGYFPNVERALAHAHPRSKKPIKYEFEVIRQHRRPDFIAYDLKNDIAAEYSGAMTPAIAELLNAEQDEVTFMTRADIRKQVGNFKIDTATRRSLEAFVAAAKTGNVTKSQKKSAEESLMRLIDAGIGTSVAGGKRIEGLFGMSAAGGFKIPSRAYAEVQLAQSKFYALARRIGAEGLARRFSAAAGDPTTDKVVQDVIDYVELVATRGVPAGFRMFFDVSTARNLKRLLDNYVAGDIQAGRRAAAIFMQRVSDKSGWVSSGLSESRGILRKYSKDISQSNYDDLSEGRQKDTMRKEKLAEERLRGEIRKQLRLIEAAEKADVGKELTSTAKSDKAIEYIEKNPAITKVIDSLQTSSDLAAFMQGVIAMATRENIDQDELKSALAKVVSGVKSAKPDKS